MVQQIVDENGTLRHIILSAINNNGASPGATAVPAATLLPQNQSFQSYLGHATPAPAPCCCCCYCSGTSGTPMPPPPPPQTQPPVIPAPAVHPNGLLAFPGQTTRRRTPGTRFSNSSFSKRNNNAANSATGTPFLTSHNGNNLQHGVSGTKSPNRGKSAGLLPMQNIHVEAVSKRIAPTNHDSNQTSLNHSNTSSELISNACVVTELLTKNSSSNTPLQYNCKSFQPKSPKGTGPRESLDLLNNSVCLHNSSASPTSVDSSAGYASDKYADERDLFPSNGLPNGHGHGSCHSRTSSSSPVDGGSENGHIELKLGNELTLDEGHGMCKHRSDSSDILSTDTELSTLEVSIGSFADDSRGGSELSLDMSLEKAVEQKESLIEKIREQKRAVEESHSRNIKLQESFRQNMRKAESPSKKSPVKVLIEDSKSAKECGERKATSHAVSQESQVVKKPSANQKFTSGAFEEINSDKCKPNGSCDKSLEVKSEPSEILEEKVINSNISSISSSSNSSPKESRLSSIDRKSDRRRSGLRKRDTKLSNHKSTESQPSSSSSRASSTDKVLPPAIVAPAAGPRDEHLLVPRDASPISANELRAELPRASIETQTQTSGKPSPQRSPKHSLPQIQLLNLTYTALTANSVKLKWTHQKFESDTGPSSLKESVSGARHYLVEMTHSKGDGLGGSSNGSPTPAGRLVYQGNMNTCRVAHLNCQQQYSFRVRMALDEQLAVSNLLTITTPEQAPPVKHKKQSKQQSLQQQLQHQQQLLAAQLLAQQQHNTHQQHELSHRADDASDPAEKSDQRCAIMILLVFTLLAIAVAVVAQWLLAE